MKRTMLLLALTVVLSLPARADLTIVQKIEGIAAFKQLTIKLKGDKARVEVSPEMTVIIDNKTGETLNLMNSKKKFLRMSADKSKAIADLVAKYGKDSSGSATATTKPKPKPTGKKETIDGYETEEYVRESPAMKETYWIAPSYPDSAAILNQLQAITPTAWNEIAKGVFDYRDFPGLPLRTIIKTNSNEITSTILSVKKASLGDAEFTVPKDFEELKVPNLNEILSEKPSTPASKNP